MTLSEPTTAPAASTPMPGHERLWRTVLAAAIVGGPLAFDIGGALAPSIHEGGQETIAANAAANAAANSGHVAAFFVASFLLPIGVAGLAYLAYPRTPWLATVGGLLGVIGWLPLGALNALDDLARVIVQQPDSAAYATLLDRFTFDATMNTYLVVYVAGHLVAYVLLGIALRRARVVPAWAAWALIASSPVTVLAFALPGTVSGGQAGTVAFGLGFLAVSLLVVGSLPAAWEIAAGRGGKR